MSHTPEDHIREEPIRRLSTDEDPRGRRHREEVHSVDLKPKKAKTRDREEEERHRVRILSYEQASD
jgi:hypothetical protein